MNKTEQKLIERLVGVLESHKRALGVLEARVIALESLISKRRGKGSLEIDLSGVMSEEEQQKVWAEVFKSRERRQEQGTE